MLQRPAHPTPGLPPSTLTDLNDGIPGAIELLSKGSVHADFWDWWYGADFKWEKGADAEEDGSGEGQEAAAAQQQATAAATAASSSGDEYGEVAKQLHSAVEHAQPPGSPVAHSSPGAGNQQQFVAGVDLRIPFRWAAQRSCSGRLLYCWGGQSVAGVATHPLTALTQPQQCPAHSGAGMQVRQQAARLSGGAAAAHVPPDPTPPVPPHPAAACGRPTTCAHRSPTTSRGTRGCWTMFGEGPA